jgi:O-methyltransferase involved in polyketide biosynthesis
VKANKASTTARLIAAATIMREREGDAGAAAPQGAAAWCQRLLSQTHVDRLLQRSVEAAIGRGGWRLVERLVLPGIISHWMRRKQEIDRIAHEAIAEQFEQLVVLGAGFDTLALRHAEMRSFKSIIAADHPATLASVRGALGVVPVGLATRPIDLMKDDVAASLAACPAFNSALPTVIVIEGVLMYLSEDKVARVFRALASLPRVRLVASWMVAVPGQPIGFRRQSGLIPGWLKREGEPMLWASTCPAMSQLLASTGWAHERFLDLSEPSSSNPTAARGLPDEQLVIADRV